MEVTQREHGGPCCAPAACYGVACFGKHFGARGMVLHTDSEFIARWAQGLFAEAGVAGTLRRHGTGGWEFAVRDPHEADKLLALLNHSGTETALRIAFENLECGGCEAAFIAAAFLCCGTIINPEKGYMLEFVSPRHRLMRDFAELLRRRGLDPRGTVRGGLSVLYFKQSEQIEDLLTTMGATQSALDIMNVKVYRDFRNRANRITNCETANIDKIVSAGRQTIDAIHALEGAGALDSLPAPLVEAARLRLAHPDLSLGELAQRSSSPVSKSGLSHRYKKIREKAEEMRSKINLPEQLKHQKNSERIAHGTEH